MKEKEYDDSADKQSEGETETPISEDWFNIFEKEASQKSSDDMQLRFAQVLAGEIEKPGSHSIKAIKALGDMDQTITNLFRRLCSLCIVLEPPFQYLFDIRVPTMEGDPSQNSLSKYGLSFDTLNKLHEYGFIISDYNSYIPYQMSIRNKDNEVVAVPFRHQGQHWAFFPSQGYTEGNEFRINGVKLSNVGQELFHIVDPIDTLQFTQDLKAFFEQKNLQMRPVIVV